MSAALRISAITLGLAVLLAGAAALWLRASAGGETPHVRFSAENIGPRALEDLTGKSVPRDYALAWQTMEQALDENRPAILEGYFTGFAKQDLTDRVKGQIRSGLHTRYQDRGHKVEAIFYAPAGDAMQLRDRAELDVQIFDGDKVIHEETLNASYIVLMTPGADRWLVRQIQAEPEKP